MALLPEVFQVSEAREGVVIKELLWGADFILPLRHLEIIPSKPPLFHWLSFFFAKIFSEYLTPELLLRFCSLLSASCLVGALAVFSSRHIAKNWSILAPIILISNYNFLRLGSDGRVDMLFCFFLSSSLLIALDSFLLTGEFFKKRSWLFVILLLGAVLTKGPLALLLAWAILFAWSLVPFNFKFSFKFFFKFTFKAEWFLVTLLSSLWYVLAFIKGGSGFLNRVFFENAGRFSGASGIVQKPFYFYLEHFWLQFAPWSFVLLFISIFCFLNLKKVINLYNSKLTEKEKSILFKSLVFFLLVIIFLSLSSGKRKGYLLLCSLPFSLILTLTLKLLLKALEENKVFLRIFELSSKIFCLLVVLISLIIFIPGLENHFGESNRLYFSLLESAAWENIFFTSLLLGVGSFLILFLLNKKDKFYLNAFLFSLSFLMIFHLPLLMSIKAKTRSYKIFAHEISSILTDDEKRRVYIIKENDNENYESLFYYFPERIRLLDEDISIAKIKKLGNDNFYLLKKELYAKNFKNITPILSGGKLSDSKEESLVLLSLNN